MRRSAIRHRLPGLAAVALIGVLGGCSPRTEQPAPNPVNVTPTEKRVTDGRAADPRKPTSCTQNCVRYGDEWLNKSELPTPEPQAPSCDPGQGTGCAGGIVVFPQQPDTGD